MEASLGKSLPPSPAHTHKHDAKSLNVGGGDCKNLEDCFRSHLQIDEDSWRLQASLKGLATLSLATVRWGVHPRTNNSCLTPFQSHWVLLSAFHSTFSPPQVSFSMHCLNEWMALACLSGADCPSQPRESRQCVPWCGGCWGPNLCGQVRWGNRVVFSLPLWLLI